MTRSLPIRPPKRLPLITREAKEALPMDEAVIAYTYGSAYAEFAEHQKGTLSKGKLADLVVLSQNIFEIPPDALPATTSLLTMVGGKIIHNVMNR